MATHAEDLRRFGDDPQVKRLEQAFLDVVKRNGRAHHRALLAEMRKGQANPATEPMQELAFAIKGKLGCFAPKAREKKRPAPAGETLAYFPGCLTTESAREYDATIRAVAKEIGLGLEDINGWGCCGGGFESAEAAAFAKRNVERAGGRAITSGCPVCIAETQKSSPGASATHILGILARPDILAKIADKIKTTGEKRPVGSLKVAVLYPPLPQGEGWGEGGAPLELLMETAGAKVMPWAGRNRSTGGYLIYAKPDVGFEMLRKVFRDFESSGADAIVTACPHCHFNLDAFQFPIGVARKQALEVPILHFTEVLALAMNLDVERELERHVTSLLPLVERLINEEAKRQAAEKKAEKRQ